MNLRTAPDTPLDAERWAAVLAKDARCDGDFVFAVKTTGIYCRPSCPARPARRENVEFFDTPVQAARAAYRPCKRCRPDGMSLTDERRAKVLGACDAIQRSDTGLSLDDLAARAGTSPHHFHRVFKSVTGLTPKQYEKAVRARRLTDALQGATTVTEAVYDAGFQSASRFYEDAGDTLGMSPGRFRNGGQGETLRFAIGPCPLGRMLVAATARGVCAIEFSDEDTALRERLRERFPQATFEAGDEEFHRWVDQILGFLVQPEGWLDLPLDVQGTVFQQRVWAALRRIPVGHTVSYTELARRVGQPSAVRAVASACANNDVALAIPCHRVVRRNGDLAGYRWGVARKAELLRREATNVDGRPDDAG